MTPTEAREAAYDAAYAELLGGFVYARDYARRLSEYDIACDEIDARYAEWVAAIEAQQSSMTE